MGKSVSTVGESEKLADQRRSNANAVEFRLSENPYGGQAMLVDANTQNPVTHLPRRSQVELEEVLARLQPATVSAMERQIEEWADTTGEERTDFFASNWLTGNDWKAAANGVFEPLYEACLGRHENPVEYAGWMFGWLVRRVMIRLGQRENWCLYKNPEAGTDALPRNMWGTFYWRTTRS